jgi:hypothetical protein
MKTLPKTAQQVLLGVTRPPADAALTDVLLFRVGHHNGLGSGADDRWPVNSIFQLLLALTQPVASFFAAFLHFPVTGISRLVGKITFELGRTGALSGLAPCYNR